MHMHVHMDTHAHTHMHVHMHMHFAHAHAHAHASQAIEFPVDANEVSAESADSFDKIEHWMDGGA